MYRWGKLSPNLFVKRSKWSAHWILIPSQIWSAFKPFCSTSTYPPLETKNVPFPLPTGTIPDEPITEIVQLIERYHCAKFGAFNPMGTVILPFSSSGTHLSPLGPKSVPPWKNSGWTRLAQSWNWSARRILSLCPIWCLKPYAKCTIPLILCTIWLHWWCFF